MSKISRAFLFVSLLWSVYLVYLLGYFPIVSQAGTGYIFPFFRFRSSSDYQTLTNIVMAVTFLAWVFWGIAFLTNE